jgi:hypothetical protein
MAFSTGTMATPEPYNMVARCLEILLAFLGLLVVMLKRAEKLRLIFFY